MVKKMMLLATGVVIGVVGLLVAVFGWNGMVFVLLVLAGAKVG